MLLRSDYTTARPRMQSSPASAHPRFFGDWDLPLQPTREDAPHKVSTQRLQSCPSANPANPASDRECNPVRQVRIPDFSAIGICPCNRREKTRLIGIDPTSAILSICKSRKSCFRIRLPKKLGHTRRLQWKGSDYVFYLRHLVVLCLRPIYAQGFTGYYRPLNTGHRSSHNEKRSHDTGFGGC